MIPHLRDAGRPGATTREDGRVSASSLTIHYATFLSELLAWLNGRFAPDETTIVADTPLFAGGLIESLRVLEVVAWTEREIGHEISDVSIRIDNFATPARIAELFATRPGDASR